MTEVSAKLKPVARPRSDDPRRNKVMLSLTDEGLETLKRAAERAGEPNVAVFARRRLAEAIAADEAKAAREEARSAANFRPDPKPAAKQPAKRR